MQSTHGKEHVQSKRLQVEQKKRSVLRRSSYPCFVHRLRAVRQEKPVPGRRRRQMQVAWQERFMHTSDLIDGRRRVRAACEETASSSSSSSSFEFMYGILSNRIKEYPNSMTCLENECASAFGVYEDDSAFTASRPLQWRDSKNHRWIPLLRPAAPQSWLHSYEEPR